MNIYQPKTALVCLKLKKKQTFELDVTKTEFVPRQLPIARTYLQHYGTLYYLLREQDRLTILKFFYHPEHTKSTLFA